MKIIHCADLHLDSKLTANLSAEKARERRNELNKTYERMVDYAAQHAVEAIIIAGDLFDTRRVSALARNTVLGKIRQYPEIDFYYLRGNHDNDNVFDNNGEMPGNLKLFGESWQTYAAGSRRDSSRQKNTCQAGNITITGVELELCRGETIYDSLILDQDRFNIVVLHGQESTYGARDKAEVINLNALRNKGIDYLALGHIHTYKEKELDRRGRYCYSGCLEGRGFDETGACGFVLLDIDPEKRVCTTEFIPFAARTLYELPIDISGCMTSPEIIAQVRQVLRHEDYSPKSLVKIILTGSVDVECEKNLELLRMQLEDDYYFIKIYDQTRLAVDYRLFALDESLKGEFVRTVNAAAELDEDTKAEIIRYGILALAGEEIR